MDENGYSFIIMVNGMKDLVSALVAGRMHTFETSRECAIRSYRVYGTTARARLYADDTKDRYFHIYYSSGRQAAEREQLEQRIDGYKKLLRRVEGQVISFSRNITHYFDIYYGKGGRFLYAREKASVVES